MSILRGYFFALEYECLKHPTFYVALEWVGYTLDNYIWEEQERCV